jgi:bidirectional [NiFe] hydrogenase diaphorase subunit
MTPDELDQTAVDERARRKPLQIRCCTAAGCLNAGGAAAHDSIRAAVATAGLTDRAEIMSVGCLKMCGAGPLVRVDPDGQLFAGVTPGDGPAVVNAARGGSAVSLRRLDLGHPFFAAQTPVVLENCGRVEPERIESAIEAGAYRALVRVLREIPPDEVIDAVTQSGLRGRGGAGYPTGVKWSLAAKTPGGAKYVVCNADEGDPGAFKDRTVLESDPHRLIEGMAIAGYAIGARQGFIYVRGEYPLAVHRLEIALGQARKHGILGGRVLGFPFAFDIEVRIGAGAYVCGEETALMASIEGQRGVPRPRPPYPGESGLWGSPTLINNVETLSSIAPIMLRGPDWYAAMGTGRSRGTKVFSVSGHVRHTGVMEIPMGTPLRQIVEAMGGGTPDGRPIKAVQTGGPAGGFVPAHLLDTPVDYEAMAAIGSIVGSGGMVVLDESTDMVDIARFFMDFCRDESCGKCIPCRAGTVQLHGLLDRIHRGDGTRTDLIRLETLSDMVKQTSLCGLGQSAPNPALSSLRHFRGEYEAKLRPS